MDLKNLIDNAQKLPNIPKVVQELIESFGDENINNEAIAKKISADQVLTAKVLRAANSAHYGGNRKVGSVSDAVFVLGFNAVRTLVLASGMTGAFKAPEGFDLPAIECVQVVRPTKSLSMWLQIVGRGLRTAHGKKHAVIIDHTRNWQLLGLPDEDREWTLEPITLEDSAKRFLHMENKERQLSFYANQQSQ